MRNLRNIAIIKIGIITAVIFGFGFMPQTEVWQDQSKTALKDHVQHILLSDKDAAHIFVLTDKDIFKSEDAGVNFIHLFTVSGSGSLINNGYIFSDKKIYLATTKGLFESVDEGKSWKRTYSSSNEEEQNCLSLFIKDDVIYLGTESGVFIKKLKENKWRRFIEISKRESIYQILGKSDGIYFMTADKILRMDLSKRKVEEIWSPGIGSFNEDVESDYEQQLIKDVYFVGEKEMLIASVRGVYEGNIEEGFKRLASNGLPLKHINTLLVYPQFNCENDELSCYRILAGTEKGVYLYTQQKWISLYQGMQANEINDLVFSTDNTIYAATDKGIFSLIAQEQSIDNFDESEDKNWEPSVGLVSYQQMTKRFENEPDIAQVHQMAIKYAEVHPEKIEQWRKLAQKRAWLPSVNIGVDGSKDWGASDSVYGTSSSGGSHYVGPDDKSWGEDLGWDVSLSWNFADLLWSTDQTTIDSRSKLMVELREDILDQATRLYFERRRVQFELIETVEEEPNIRIEKEMRVAELTALIDALTGGEFSRSTGDY